MSDVKKVTIHGPWPWDKELADHVHVEFDDGTEVYFRSKLSISREQAIKHAMMIKMKHATEPR